MVVTEDLDFSHGNSGHEKQVFQETRSCRDSCEVGLQDGGVILCDSQQWWVTGEGLHVGVDTRECGSLACLLWKLAPTSHCIPHYLLTPLTPAVSFFPPDWASLVAQTVKNCLQCRRPGFHPCRRSPGGGQGNALQYLALENPLDRGAWWATVHEAAKSRTWLSD